MLRTCGLETFVLCATKCIHHVFKCIRNVYDSVKFLCDVMLLFQPWAVLAVSDRSKPCSVLAGVDRSDRSVVAALHVDLLMCFTCHIAARVIL